MRTRSLLFIPLIFISFLYSNGQVIRKGSRPNNTSKAEVIKEYSIQQLEGKWQEVKRAYLFKKNSSIYFSDSLLMSFIKGKAEVKDATSMKMTLRGTADIEAPNTLYVAGDLYSIRFLDKNILIVADEEFIRELHKTDQFYYETVGKIKVEKDSFSNPVNIDTKNLAGKWIVYARHAEPGVTESQTALIKTIDIRSVAEDGIATGEIVFYTKDVTETFPCKLLIKDGNIQINADKYIWNFYSYKADGNEFVFGETGKLVYYAKRL